MGAGAVGAGVVNSFVAFWTVNVKPQAVGATTINHATAIKAGDDFLPVIAAIVCFSLSLLICQSSGGCSAATATLGYAQHCWLSDG